MKSLSFDALPGTTRLFRDYLYEPSLVQKFFRHLGDPQSRLEEVTHGAWHRDELVRILTRQNRSGSSRSQVELLARPTTFAVVTGQQVGLFGGPLYTLYKALGTILHCRQLDKQFPKYRFVPVFWLELEDHDFDEVRRTFILSQSGEVQEVSIGEAGQNNQRLRVCDIRLDSSLPDRIARLGEQLGKTDFTTQWMDKLLASYAPGMAMGEAFAGWMNEWLGPLGLILFDPSDPELKRLARPIFLKELDHAAETHACIVETGEQLISAGYHAQLQVTGSNLFVLTEGLTCLFPTTGAKTKLDLSVMAAHSAFLRGLLESEPERFVPNVALRPIVQDFLLPTFAYVAGPSEIAYSAQLGKLYNFFGVQQPLIFPRPFATIIEKKIGKILDKYSMDLERMVASPTSLVQSMVMVDSIVPKLFAEWRARAETDLRLARTQLLALDASLQGSVETAQQRIAQALQALEGKATEAQKRQSDLLVRQVEKALAHLLPQGALQERTLNMVYYLNKYGPEFLSFLQDKLRIDTSNHQILEI